VPGDEKSGADLGLVNFGEKNNFLKIRWRPMPAPHALCTISVVLLVFWGGFWGFPKIDFQKKCFFKKKTAVF